jgi:hypothetical protein
MGALVHNAEARAGKCELTACQTGGISFSIKNLYILFYTY